MELHHSFVIMVIYQICFKLVLYWSKFAFCVLLWVGFVGRINELRRAIDILLLSGHVSWTNLIWIEMLSNIQVHTRKQFPASKKKRQKFNTSSFDSSV